MNTTKNIRTLALGALLTTFAISASAQETATLDSDERKADTEMNEDLQSDRDAMLSELKEERKAIDQEMEKMENDFNSLGDEVSAESKKIYLDAKDRLLASAVDLDKQIDQIENTSDEQWENTKGDLDRAWKDTKTALDNARKDVSDFFRSTEEERYDDLDDE